MTITKDIRYIGVNDHAVDLFEGQYVVPGGMCYNSYAIVDEKTGALPISGWTTFRTPWAAASRTTWWCSTWSLTTPPTSPIS